jgi:AcrR family transcriptional regulator
MGRPRKDAGRDTRRDILDRSLDLFADRGFFGTSTRDIARAVGVRESALYHHFPSKDAILKGLLAELGPGQAMAVLELDVGALADALGGEGSIRRMAETVIAIWSTPEEQKFLRLMLSEGPRLGSEGVVHFPTYLLKARALLSRVFETLLQKRMIRAVDPLAATVAFLGPMVMLRWAYLSAPGTPTDFKALNAEVERHVAFFWDSVRPLASPARARRRRVR